MSAFASPLQITAITAAVAWPLAAGLGLVVWSKFRAGAHQRRAMALDGRMRGLYREMEVQPTPDRLALVVDALEEHDAIAAAAAGVRRPLRARASA
jgi:hypothetical protein